MEKNALGRSCFRLVRPLATECACVRLPFPVQARDTVGFLMGPRLTWLVLFVLFATSSANEGVTVTLYNNSALQGEGVSRRLASGAELGDGIRFSSPTPFSVEVLGMLQFPSAATYEFRCRCVPRPSRRRIQTRVHDRGAQGGKGMAQQLHPLSTRPRCFVAYFPLITRSRRAGAIDMQTSDVEAGPAD